MSYLSTTLTVLYYIVSPIIYALHIIITILLTIAAPVLHLGHYLVYACWYPVNILGKFETLYIFFGVAVVVGILTGTSLHYVSGFMVSVLRLEVQSQANQGGRSLANYRAEKLEREVKKEDPLEKLVRESKALPRDDSALANELKDWQWAKEKRGRSRNGSMPNTILEEEDSSEGGLY